MIVRRWIYLYVYIERWMDGDSEIDRQINRLVGRWIDKLVGR
jgi:hypothetical protein